MLESNMRCFEQKYEKDNKITVKDLKLKKSQMLLLL